MSGKNDHCKVNTTISNQVGRFRAEAGLSAVDLAAQAGVSRQTIYAIEAGDFVPNTTVALKMAKALSTTVEALFSVEAEQAAEPLEPMRLNQPTRLAYVNGQLIAVPATPLHLPVSTAPANNSIIIAGCDPAISALGAHVIPYNCGSTRALELLAAGKVHIAGTHIGKYPKVGHRIVTLAHWQEGLVTAPGNPKGIHSIADLAGRRIVNREQGSGSRLLLDRELRKAGIPESAVPGYRKMASGHLEAAWYVSTGLADACIAPTSAARAYGLPLHAVTTERYDLIIPESFTAEAFLNLLVSGPIRRLLETEAGYDTAHTGETVPASSARP